MGSFINLKEIKEIMYLMFKDGNLPEMHMEDYDVMWQALIERNGHKKYFDNFGDNWYLFLDEINVKASENREFFMDKFKIFEKDV